MPRDVLVRRTGGTNPRWEETLSSLPAWWGWVCHVDLLCSVSPLFSPGLSCPPALLPGSEAHPTIASSQGGLADLRPFLGRLTFAATGKKPEGKLKFGSLHPSWPPPLGRLHRSLHPKCGGEALSFPWPPLRVSSKFPSLLWGMLHLETTALCLVRTGASLKLVLFLNSAFFKIREGGAMTCLRTRLVRDRGGSEAGI